VLKNHAVELCREQIWSRVDELKSLQNRSGNEFATSNLKDSVVTQLKRLIPGNDMTLTAMRSKDGCISSDPANMANTLNEHWSAVFSRKDVCLNKLRSWLVGVPPMSDHLDRRWALKLKHVELAIEQSNASAPGPDGIPYAAWKAIKDIWGDSFV